MGPKQDPKTRVQSTMSVQYGLYNNGATRILPMVFNLCKDVYFIINNRSFHNINLSKSAHIYNTRLALTLVDRVRELGNVLPGRV